MPKSVRLSCHVRCRWTLSTDTMNMFYQCVFSRMSQLSHWRGLEDVYTAPEVAPATTILCNPRINWYYLAANCSWCLWRVQQGVKTDVVIKFCEQKKWHEIINPQVSIVLSPYLLYLSILVNLISDAISTAWMGPQLLIIMWTKEINKECTVQHRQEKALVSENFPPCVWNLSNRHFFKQAFFQTHFFKQAFFQLL